MTAESGHGASRESAEQALATLDRVLLLIRAGVPLRRAVTMDADGALEINNPNARAVLSVALSTGAPLSTTVRRLQSLMRNETVAVEEVRSALAAPLLARRIVMFVPVASIALGTALGFDVVTALVSTTLGVLCLVGGTLLSLIGWVWMRRLIKRATAHDAAPGLWCELVAVAVGSGLPLGRAVRVAEHAMKCGGLPLSFRDRAQGVRLLTVAAQAGVSVSVALQNLADDQRAARFADRRRSARELGERILVPVGVCYLPAFLLWGVVPLVGSVVSDTLVVG